MKHIFHFNKSVEKLLLQIPSNAICLTIEKYRKERNLRDYYQTLDSLGLKVGVEYYVQQVFNEDKGKITSYIACIKLHEGNPITKEYHEIELHEYNSAEEAYGYVAKELIYRLMTIQNLDEILAA